MMPTQSTAKSTTDGTAGLMEVSAAKYMWGRSLERLLRYTTLISDGDSKTFDALTALHPYGEHVEIFKEECTNHVSKRLGTRLCNLCSKEAIRGTTLGGKKQGSLTQVKINKLQAFYKSADSSKCGSIEELRVKIFSALEHALLMRGPTIPSAQRDMNHGVSTTKLLLLGQFPHLTLDRVQWSFLLRF